MSARDDVPAHLSDEVVARIAELQAVDPMPPTPLEEVHGVFVRWLGEDYDLDALNAVLATAAVELMDGDPLWLLLISGSGNAKTETVQALAGAGALVTSTITSEGALLSATSKKERSSDATGGLLRKMGDSGVMVIKDVTSILSMHRDARNQVLGALREVYDGRWSRNVGTDGGRTLDWEGRLAVVGAVTTAWDKAHAVIASMGDRFVLVRMDSTTGRQVAGRRAIGNTGHEVQMRAELAEVVGGLLGSVTPSGVNLTRQETDALLAAADLVTLARTAVEYDYRGDVIDAHAPEMPTRFAKQLAQVVRGGVAIGLGRGAALRLAIRCARDSMPPLRLALVDDLAAHPDSSLAEVRRRMALPRSTIDRQLQALDMLGVLTSDEEEDTYRGREVTRWRYRLADGIDPRALEPGFINQKCHITPPTPNEEGGGEAELCLPPDISGEYRPTLSNKPDEPARTDDSERRTPVAKPHEPTTFDDLLDAAPAACSVCAQPLDVAAEMVGATVCTSCELAGMRR